MKASVLESIFSAKTVEHDQADHVARSKERYRRAGTTALMSALAKAVGIASVLVTMPATLKYLGAERFSIWMTITSLTALLSFADFGLGNGLMNAVARSWSSRNNKAVAEYTCAAFAVLGAIAAVSIVAVLLIGPMIPWNKLLAVNPMYVSAPELDTIMKTFVICMAVAIPLATVQKIQLAMQLGNLANAWQLIASVAGLAAILLAIHFQAPLAILVFAALGTPSIVISIGALIFWMYQQPQCSPLLATPKLACMRDLMGSGILFFIIQVAGCVAFASDTLIVAHLLGPAAVAQYSVVARLIDGIVMISSFVLTPLWPAYTDAQVRGDTHWIRKTLKLSMLGTVVATAIAALVLIILSSYITRIWMGPTVPYSLALFIAGGLWAIVKAAGNAFAMFLNGLGWIHFQAASAVGLAVMAIATKLSLVGLMGIIGVPVAMIASYVIAVVIPTLTQMPKIMSRLTV